MNNSSLIGGSTFTEVNLRILLKTIFKRKWLFILSMAACMGLGWLYTHVTEPTYEVSSRMLVDIFKKSSLPENRIIGGHITPLKGKKNIYNELMVIKSYEVVQNALKSMNANVSYHISNSYLQREKYGYFPFEVTLIDTSRQLVEVPFEVTFLSDSTYQLTVDVKQFAVLDTDKKDTRTVERSFDFQDTFQFGEIVDNEYFHFILNKPDYKVIASDFEGYNFSFQMHNYRDLTSQYIESLQINLYDIESSIVFLSSRGPVLPKQKDFHKNLAKEYIAYLGRARANATYGRNAFIKRQMAIYKDSLSHAEQDLELYKQSSSAINLAYSSTTALVQFDSLETENNQLSTKIRYYYSVLKYLNEEEEGQVIAPSVVGIKDPLLNQSLVDLKRLNAEKDRLTYTKGKESIDLQIVEKQVQETKEFLQENLRNLVETTRLELEDKQQQIAVLDMTISTLPEKERAYIKFKRKTNLYGSLYTYLGQELAKSGISGSENVNDTQILDNPRMMGDGPFWPQRLLIRILTFFLGIIIPLILLVILESMNDVIKTERQIETYTDIPVIGKIARLKSKSKLFSKGNYQWQVEESFRNLCAGLQFNITDPKKNVIGIISTIPDEGKTFCAINLAVNLANSGKKVLLIDTDFRKPGITSDVDKIKGRGFSNYLKGEILSANEVIHLHKELPSLHYVPTLVEDLNPQELLTSERLPIFIEGLRPQYDYIIFDAPAMGVVSDYLLIAPFMDVHLYVLRSGISRFPFINDLEKKRQKGGMKEIYFVLNDVKVNSKYDYSYKSKNDESSGNLVRKFLLS